LTQHLANNLIDMYINLPSKNHYRRPASYASKGYRTRRMAVDFAVPLITNVKVAKILFEALVRRLPLDVSPIDFKTSHNTYTLPGLINVSAYVPGLTGLTPADFVEATKASISGGFSTALVLPFAETGVIADQKTLERIRTNIANSAYSNYALSITATPGNVGSLDEDLQADAKSLFIPSDFTDMNGLATHFSSWSSNKLIVTNAKGTQLAPILLLAGLHNRAVHVTDVQSKDEILLISLSKSKQLNVTCDVSVYSLFFTREQFGGVDCLPTVDDQRALWKNLETIDAFSTGNVPFRLAKALGKESSAWSGVEETLPLLLSAVSSGRLALEDITLRLHDNPIRIFGLPDQAHTAVEVVVGKSARVPTVARKSKTWTPAESRLLDGSVHRVLVHGQTAFLDGVLTATPLGRDVSSAVIVHPTRERATSISSTAPTKPELSLLFSPPRAAEQFSAVPQSALYGPINAPLGLTNLRPHPAYYRKHILSVKQFVHRDIHDLFSLAHEMQLQVERNGTLDILKGKVLCTMFYEPSTRTSSSFDAAMKRCGGEVVNVNIDTSSVLKGETLPDTIRTLGCYADAVVLRHPDVGSSQLAAKFSPVPVINAGDGIGEHPTQVCAFAVLTCSLSCLFRFVGPA
jgi:carbamoyl-phosphate synthase / aspartate carbamoyltransferase